MAVVGVSLFYLVNFTSVAQGETYDVYPGNSYDFWIEAYCSYGCPIHIWAYSSDSAGSWAYPDYVDFGSVYDTQRMSYQLDVPNYISPGQYALYWDYSCETYTGGRCNIDADYRFTINVKSWDQYCKATYGSNYYYDSYDDICYSSAPSYGGYSSWNQYCKATYGSNYYYDSNSHICRG